MDFNIENRRILIKITECSESTPIGFYELINALNYFSFL